MGSSNPATLYYEIVLALSVVLTAYMLSGGRNILHPK